MAAHRRECPGPRARSRCATPELNDSAAAGVSMTHTPRPSASERRSPDQSRVTDASTVSNGDRNIQRMLRQTRGRHVQCRAIHDRAT